MSMTFNPMAVMMGQAGKPGIPYTGVPKPKAPILYAPKNSTGAPASSAPSAPSPSSTTLAPEAIRSSGAGPFDPAYRQNLATFAGGLFARPGGNLSFNPTSNQPFGGAATGGGDAPVMGMPNTLLQNAFGGNPFSFTPPVPASGANNSQPNTTQMQDWLNSFMQNGKGLRSASML